MCCVPAAHRMDRPWRGGPETPEEIGCRDEAAPATPRAGSVCVCVCVCARGRIFWHAVCLNLGPSDGCGSLR